MMLPRLKNKTMNLLLSFVKLMGGCAERMTNMFKVVYEAAIRERQIKSAHNNLFSRVQIFVSLILGFILKWLR